MIRVSTEGSRCVVKFGHEKSEEFQTTTGLKQGDALSPILFNIVLEMAVREVQEEYQGINCGRNLPVLAYADDVVILGESEQDIQKATELLIRSAKKRGLNINETKTKYMRIGRNKGQMRNAAGLQVGGYMFEEVDNFKYLGTNLSSTNDNHEEIKKRTISGNKYFYALSGLLGSKLLSKKSKERLYMVLARPVIMYACETWPTTQGDENRLAIMERKFLRRIYEPKRYEDQTYEIRTNRELQELFGKPDIIAEIRHKRLSWLGHVLRAKSIANAVLRWIPQGRRPIGRPKQRWMDKNKKELNKLGIDNITEATMNRDRWKEICFVAMGLNGL
ncbi:uncharacterized protein LOC126905353 [Daktulosphaira vitifoliae]|uniref:uncharacterized protein LOC126905353 n=1 Tax=Daktulosphaira vitifoliae TaxID=58002 RepID=UPI0021A97B05|nr:uncharacterized protein LOC126905353 [Daktulosphaira vitifoliae]